MDSDLTGHKAALPARRATRGLVLVQWWLGLGTTLFFALPYLRRAYGLSRLDRRRRHLFVCNHVSLLDTILLGSLCWRAGCIPILVLGDKSVWRANWIKTMLSSKIGFLLERGKFNPKRIEELRAFARCHQEFQLIVFPEGTRGDGTNVKACQPGIYYIAQEARLPLVPVFFRNMELISTKAGPLHLFSGLRKVEVHFAPSVEPDEYLHLSREDFLEFVRNKIAAAREP